VDSDTAETNFKKFPSDSEAASPSENSKPQAEGIESTQAWTPSPLPEQVSHNTKVDIKTDSESVRVTLGVRKVQLELQKLTGQAQADHSESYHCQCAMQTRSQPEWTPSETTVRGQGAGLGAEGIGGPETRRSRSFKCRTYSLSLRNEVSLRLLLPSGPPLSTRTPKLLRVRL
jgi:hypothetical protein